ncbi:hypothetical protein Clacol_003482 [Clathrus columnatus]|uniref:Uncharacterized protein n=1 Tax=Clathrus columnatus TaxID=1419009 RepID=A0AAV5A8G6_9AGAM|nr:hypothetical protein Clacol_003482 [Clathrus columnatus]
MASDRLKTDMSTVNRKVAVVTGASAGGIGFYLCQSLLNRGFIVYATARTLAAMNELEHPNVRKVALEVTNDEQVEATFKSLFDNEERLDLVINNAGTYSTGPLVENSSDHFKYVLDVNVVSILRVCRAVVPPSPWAGIYQSSKAAVRVFTEVLEMECRPFHVRVVLVEPGSVESKLCDNFVDYTPPEGSVYSNLVESIRYRVTMSRNNCMTSDVFAELLVPKIIRPRPPKYILDGNKWLIFTILSWLPRSWALNVLYFWMVTLKKP